MKLLKSSYALMGSSPNLPTSTQQYLNYTKFSQTNVIENKNITKCPYGLIYEYLTSLIKVYRINL